MTNANSTTAPTPSGHRPWAGGGGRASTSGGGDSASSSVGDAAEIMLPSEMTESMETQSMTSGVLPHKSHIHTHSLVSKSSEVTGCAVDTSFLWDGLGVGGEGKRPISSAEKSDLVGKTGQCQRVILDGRPRERNCDQTPAMIATAAAVCVAIGVVCAPREHAHPLVAALWDTCVGGGGGWGGGARVPGLPIRNYAGSYNSSVHMCTHVNAIHVTEK